MFNIMLVDDEPEVLTSMVAIIDWSKYGFNPPMGCHDGQSAIKAIEAGFAPDAVITDISMPHVDGLQLAAYLYETRPRCRVVILSGYDEFAYAQQAIKLQVTDYILKPITPMRLGEILEKISADLKKNRWATDADTQNIVLSDVLRKLFTSTLDVSVVEKHAQRFDIPLVNVVYIAIVMDIDPYDSAEGEDPMAWQRFSLFNIAQDLMAESGDIHVFQGRDGRLLALLWAQSADEATMRAIAFAQRLEDILDVELGCHASAGLGDPVPTLHSISRSYEGAEAALELRFYHGPGSISLAVQLHSSEIHEEKISFEDCEQKLLSALDALDYDRYFQSLDTMFQDMHRLHLPVSKCFKICQRIAVCLLRFAQDLLSPHQLTELEDEWERHDLFAIPTLMQLRELVKQFCQQTFDALDAECSDAGCMQVRKAESFIRQHYADPDLSLQSLTAHLAVSTSHFTALFKSKTGSTFVEYLTQVRMEKARQMLVYTDKRSYEVAEEVGFSDPHYFSVVFKRHAGMSPKEYRDSRHNPRTTAK